MNRIAGRRITGEVLAPLAERYGERWRVWPSAEGWYACATLRRGLSWVCSAGRQPVGARGAYVRTFVEESPEELAAAIERANEDIGHMLATGELTERPR